jgi:hypothetical protein
MRLCRIIGWIIILLAIAAAGHEIIAAFEARSYHFKAFGELWYMIDRASLNVFQAAIQRHVWPFLWDGVIAYILLMPAWLVLGVPGTLIAWLCRRRTIRREGWT